MQKTDVQLQQRKEQLAERFVRWQQLRISQLGYAINLFLGLSTAIVGFQINLLMAKSFIFICYGRFVFLASTAIVLISIIIGIACVINRLCDFRITARTARARHSGKPKDYITTLQKNHRRLSRRTWCLFWWQTATFAGGLILAGASLLPSLI